MIQENIALARKILHSSPTCAIFVQLMQYFLVSYSMPVNIINTSIIPITLLQVTENAWDKVQKARTLLDDIVAENKGKQQYMLSSCLHECRGGVRGG